MNLLVINGTDYTQHIKVPSYKVNREYQYKEWEDASYGTHREITRTKISGSFTLLYDDISELDNFFTAVETLQAASDTGAIDMTVYVNNLHSVANITAFIKYTPANERPTIFGGGFSCCEVTIKET